jgi:hypothetical protein
MVFQEDILKLDFPAKLGKGQPITGRLLIYNPAPNYVCPIAKVTLTWKTETLTFNGCEINAAISPLTWGAVPFPDYFGVDVVPMPAQNATLNAFVELRDLVYFRKQAEGTATHTIEYIPPPLEKKFLGVPVWTWLIVAGGATTTLIYIKTRKKK